MELRVRGALVRGIDRGTGPPVVFVHGNPDTSALWRDVIDRLGARHRCLAPDLPGFGRSALPPGFPWTLADLGAWLDEVVTQARLPTPVDLVVHDVGGFVGLPWAIEHPERVRRIVVTNTIFFPDYAWHRVARVWQAPLLGELAMRSLGYPGFARELRRGSRRLGEAQIRAVFDAFGPSTRREVLRLYRASAPASFRGWEQRLLALTARIPTLVVWGDADPYIEPHFAARFGARRVERLADVGHWPPAEAPAEVAAHIGAFLA